MGKETNPKINIWAKHAQTIKNHKVKTIKTLVAKLKPGAGKIPLIKGIGKNDAVAMLIDIGLSAVPFAVRYKNKLLSKFKNAPEKVDYKTLLSSLEEITREEDINEKERSYIEEAIKKAKSSKDPFDDNTLLSEHRITAPIFRKTIIDEIASTVKLKEEEILKLKQTYKSLKILIDSKNAQIKKATGIEVEKIKKIKAIVNWTEFEHVSVPIAHAFVIKKVEPQTIIETSTEDVQKIVKDSGITITRKELNDIGKVIDAVRTKMPAEAYYFDVISALNLPQKAASILENKKIRTFSDLRKNGLLDDVIKKGKIEDKELIKNIEALISLETISYDLSVNKELIQKEYHTPIDISSKTRSSFIAEMRTQIGDFNSALLYEKAITQSRFLNNITTGAMVDAANGYALGMNQLIHNLGSSPECSCEDCESAVSPLAYLVDLLDYAVNHLKQSNGDPVDLSFLSDEFGQPFGELPGSCKAVNTELRQARICIEVLRKQSIPISEEAEKSYLLNAYQALLAKLGTSYNELSMIRFLKQEERERLAMKLGIDLSVSDELGRLLLSDKAGTPDSQRLTEKNLEILFGLVDTTRNELSDGTKINDPDNSLLRWNFDGIDWNMNTDENGKVYLNFVEIDNVDKQVLVYRDEARSDLVAKSKSFNLPSTMQSYGIEILEENNSGLSGWALYSNETENRSIEISLIPEFLCWQLKNLRNLWQKIDWPDDDYSRHALPSIDPDLIGPDDIRTPLPQNPTYQIWENRRKWIDSQIQDTFYAITSGGGSPPRSRSKNLLCEMRETFTYTTRYGSTNEYRAWPDNYNIDTLDDIYRKFQKGEELEDIEQVLENTLHITTDEFSRLVEIKNKDELYTSNNNLECVTIEEWDEFISILVQIRKRVVFEGWISEEEIPSIRLDCNYFVISAGQPEQGSWPLKQDVLLDPSILPVDKIKQSLNYHKIIEIYNDHETALKTIYQRKQAEREDSSKGYIWLLEDSFGIRKAEIESWNAQLADSHMTTSANARHYVENTLQLKVEGEFDYLISIKEKQANGDTITEDEWRQIYTILTQQEKLIKLYNDWKTEEQNKEIRYWDIFPIRLVPWRSSNTARFSWQEALRNCSSSPIIDPDLIGTGHLRDQLTGRVAELWHDRRDWIKGWIASLENEKKANSDLFAAFDLFLQEVIFNFNETFFIEEWVKREKRRYGLDKVIEWIFERSMRKLTHLHSSLSHIDSNVCEDARCEIKNDLCLSVTDFVFLIDIRKRINSVGIASSAEWRSLYKILTRVVQIREFLKLDSQNKSGQNIAPYLDQLGLSYPAFKYLVQMRSLLAEETSILESDWENIYSILIQVRKMRSFPEWKREEKDPELILLGPDEFTIDEENNSIPWIWETDSSSQWRAFSRDFRDWREKLSGRTKQQESIVSEFKHVIDSVEEQVLPELRSSLINPHSGDNLARTLSDCFAISMETGGCQKTTRISQAIKTIQTLLWAVRTGLHENSTVTFVSDNFDEEWKWIGSYETWRAAMFTFLYPENLLLPSLRPKNTVTPVFENIVNNLRNNMSLTPDIILEQARIYNDYLIDMANLEIEVTSDDRLFARAKNSHKIYMCQYNRSEDTDHAQTFWEEIPIEGLPEGMFTYSIRAVFNYEINHCEHMVIILSIFEYGSSAMKIGILKYNLKSAKWEPIVLLYIHHSLIEVQREMIHRAGTVLDSPDAFNPKILVQNGGLVRIGTLNDNMSGFVDGLNHTYSYTSDPPLGIYNIGYLGKICALVAIQCDRLLVFVESSGTIGVVSFEYDYSYQYWITNNDWTTLGDEIDGDKSWLGVIRLRGSGLEHKYFAIWRIPSDGTCYCQKIRDFFPLGVLESKLIDIKFRRMAKVFWNYPTSSVLIAITMEYEWYRGLADVDIDETFSISDREIAELNPSPQVLDSIEGHPFPANISYGIEGEEIRELKPFLYSVGLFVSKEQLFWRKEYFRRLYSVFEGPQLLWNYFAEAYFFFPLLIANLLQKSGRYNDALDWYRTIYCYQLPPPQRIIYIGLINERSLPNELNRPFNWFLNDQLNPHQIASTRAYSYTRFTIMSIIGCLLEYADAEFTRDTDKSVRRAEELYKQALELLELDELNQHLDGCDQMIGAIEFSVEGPEWEPVMLKIKSNLSQISCPILLEATINEVKIQLADQSIKSMRERILKVRDIVNKAVSSQPRGKNLSQILTERPINAIEIHKKLLQNQVIELSSKRIQTLSASRFTKDIAQATGLEEKELVKKDAKIHWLSKVDTSNRVKPTSFSNINSQPVSASFYSISTAGYVPNPTRTFCVPPNPILTSLRMHAEINLYKIHTCRNIAGMKRELEPYEAPTDTTTGVVFLGLNSTLATSMKPLLTPTPYRFKVLMARAKELVQLAQQMENAFQSALEKMEAATYTLFKARQDEQIARASIRLQNLRVKASEDGVTLAEFQQERSNIMANTYQKWLDADLLDIENQLINSYHKLMELQIVQTLAQDYFQGQSVAIQIAQIVDPTGATHSVLGGLSAAAGIALVSSQLAVIEKQKSISVETFMTSHERRKQEWELQKSLAEQDIEISGQQISIAKDQVQIVEQEKRIAEMQADHAADTVEFLGNQFFNAEMYEWMSRVLERVYSYFLQQATSVARLAENQLAFERQEIPPKIIQSDYWEAIDENTVVTTNEDNNIDRRGLTGSARLLQDIYQLDQFAFETLKRKDILTKTFSLAALAPVEFVRFRETGVLQFATPMRIFDQELPGYYHRLIRRIRIAVIALIPPTHGIRAMLSTSGISRVVIGDTIFQTREVRRLPESITLTSPSHATEVMELQAEQAAELLLPFEGMGVDTNWEFRLPKAGNRFDFDTIYDILFSIDYTTLFSPIYYQQVVSQLDQYFLADHVLSIKNQLPDVWYHIHNLDESSVLQISFEITRRSFPSNVDNFEIRELLLHISGGESEVIDNTKITLSFTKSGVSGAIHGEAFPIDKTINTLTGKGRGWESFKDKSPFGNWTLEFEDSPEIRNLIKESKINDILFVISYSGDTPPWPIM